MTYRKPVCVWTGVINGEIKVNGDNMPFDRSKLLNIATVGEADVLADTVSTLREGAVCLGEREEKK